MAPVYILIKAPLTSTQKQKLNKTKEKRKEIKSYLIFINLLSPTPHWYVSADYPTHTVTYIRRHKQSCTQYNDTEAGTRIYYFFILVSGGKNFVPLGLHE